MDYQRHLLGNQEGGRVLTPHRTQSGVTLIELAIGMVIIGILMAAAMPSFRTWIQNTQIRSAAESVYNGLQVARAEAVRRNNIVRFQLMSSLDASCALSGAGSSWVVSRADASAKCDIAPSDTIDPFIIQGRSGTESSADVTVAAVDAGGGAASTVTFNGMGQVVANDDGSSPISRVDIDTVQVLADKRPLRVVVGTGGSMKMCDPSVTAPDTRAC